VHHIGCTAVNPTWFTVSVTTMFYVYILQSLKDKKLYIGFTSNLRKRLIDHNTGGTKSTKLRRPFRLIYYEAHLSKEDAKRRERYFKTSKGKNTLKQILRNTLKIN
jgi:putative endonuclease